MTKKGKEQTKERANAYEKKGETKMKRTWKGVYNWLWKGAAASRRMVHSAITIFVPESMCYISSIVNEVFPNQDEKTLVWDLLAKDFLMLEVSFQSLEILLHPGSKFLACLQVLVVSKALSLFPVSLPIKLAMMKEAETMCRKQIFAHSIICLLLWCTW